MVKKTTVVLTAVIVMFAFGHADWVNVGPSGGPIYCGVVVPGSPPAIYAASTNSSYPLLKSTDVGANWALSGAALSNYPHVLVVHPTNPNALFGVVSSQFYRSTDAGATWSTTSLGSNTYGNDIAVNPLNPQVIYVVCYKYDGAAWKPTSAKSTNGGQAWVATQVDTATSSTMYSCAIDPVDTTVVYMGGYINSQTKVYKSTDCGATWTSYGFPGSYYYVYSLLVSPTDHNVIFAGTLYGVCRSTDAGLTWTRQSTNNYNYRMVVAPDNPNIMYSAAYTTVYRSTDAGLTWASSGAGVQGSIVRTVLVVPGEPGTVFCGSTGGMFKSLDYGATWTAANYGINIGKIPAVSVNPHEPATVYAEFVDNDIFRSTDDGVTWTFANSPLSCGNVCNIAFDDHDPQRIWLLEASG